MTVSILNPVPPGGCPFSDCSITDILKLARSKASKKKLSIWDAKNGLSLVAMKLMKKCQTLSAFGYSDIHILHPRLSEAGKRCKIVYSNFVQAVSSSEAAKQKFSCVHIHV